MPDLSKLGVTMDEATQGVPGLSEMFAATMTGAAEGATRLGRAVADAIGSVSLPQPASTELNVEAEEPDRG